MAGGFDLMRFQKCSDTLIPEMRRNSKWIVFWVFACFVMFFCLGIYPAIRSEARWFEVVREMLMTGDWLHPRINGQPYFDKPLVSYWFAAIVSKLAGGQAAGQAVDSSIVMDAEAGLSMLTGGRVTELSVRLPSALFALAGLGCIISVARKFYSERTAYLAGWILLSTYSFIVWGRLAEADMEQTVFILMAVTVYMHHRETPSFWAYFAFWACCAVGAQTKGLPAFVIPPALALIDCVVRKSFRRHLNWKFFLALFLGGFCLYAVPFVLEAMTSDNYGASGIVQVFRENLVRAFDPWDHNKDPFYAYFLYLPRLLIPWTPFFLFAVIDFIRELIRAVAKQGTASVEDLSSRAVAKQGTASVEDLSSDTLWLFASIVFIFVLFSASRSRRSYYILPAVPWCILFTAAWFSEPRESWTFLRKISDKFFRLVDVLIPAAAGLLILIAVLFIPLHFDRPFYRFFLYAKDMLSLVFSFLPFAFLAGIAWLVIWRKSRKKLLREGAEGVFAPSGDPMNRVVPFVAFVLFTVFSFVIPKLSERESFEPTRNFLRYYVRQNAEGYQGDFHCPDLMKRMAFFGFINMAEITYYMDLTEPVPVYSLENPDDGNRTFPGDTADILGPDEFRTFLAEIREKGGVVITRRDWVEKLKESDDLKDIAEMLRKPGMILESSQLNGVQENKLRKLREKPDWQDDPEVMKKIRKLERKRLDVFYSIPVDAFYKTHTPESILPPASAEADGAEGTTQS